MTWAPVQRWTVSGHATGIDPVVLRPDLPGRLGFDVAIDGQGFKSGDPLSVAVGGLSGRLRGVAASGGGNSYTRGTRGRSNRFAWDLGRTHVALDGRFDRSADLRFAVTAEDLSLLSAGSRGHVEANGTVRGPLASPDILATARGADILYEGLSLTAFDAKVDFDPSSRRRSSIAAHLRGLKIHGRTVRSLHFTLDGPAAALSAHLQAQAPGLQLAAAASGGFSNGVFGGRLESLELSGQESLRLHLQQPVSLTLSGAASQDRPSLPDRQSRQPLRRNSWTPAGVVHHADREQVALGHADGGSHSRRRVPGRNRCCRANLRR